MGTAPNPGRTYRLCCLVQESAVTQLPQTMQPGNPSPEPALVPPLPFGPNERRRYHADGAVETVTAAELGLQCHGDKEATDKESDSTEATKDKSEEPKAAEGNNEENKN